MSKVAIFASGKGSNAAQIIRFLQKKKSNVKIALLLTNKKEAGVYQVANDLNIPIQYFSNEVFSEGDEVVDFLKNREIDWIVLAGFLRKVELPVINAFENRIINLHPSLLPKYGGKGMYGNYVHKAVLAAQELESGITIHLVNSEFDKGKILFQAKCDIKKVQTVEELSKKIQTLEHLYLPTVIEQTILGLDLKSMN